MSFPVLGSIPRLPPFAYGFEPYGVPPIPDDWQEKIEAAQAVLKKTAEMIEALFGTYGTNGDVGILNCDPATLPAIIARSAATCDAVIVSSDLRGNEALFCNAVHGSLVQSPVGVILNGCGMRDALRPARVFVGWDTGLPAARALHAALPLLKAATETTIEVFDPVTLRDGQNPGSEVARWLSHHGCEVDLQQYPSGGEEIGGCILGRAVETGADLVVMGAYGHSRMRQAVFGGTTRSMIEQTEMPVMLAH